MTDYLLFTNIVNFLLNKVYGDVGELRFDDSNGSWVNLAESRAAEVPWEGSRIRLGAGLIQIGALHHGGEVKDASRGNNRCCMTRTTCNLTGRVPARWT